MGTSHMNEGNLEAKAITAVVEELQRQAAENPSKLRSVEWEISSRSMERSMSTRW